MAKPALGRGLGALMGGTPGKPPVTTLPPPAPATATAPAPAKPTGEQVQRIPVSRIVPCPFQPRKDFTEDSIKELAEFWDSHDVTDFEAELETVAEPVFQRDTAITVHLPRDEADADRRGQGQATGRQGLVALEIHAEAEELECRGASGA